MCCCTHFTDEKTKSQGGEVTHSRSNSQVVAELGFKLSLHYPGPYPPGSPHFRVLWALVRCRSRMPVGGPRGSGVWRSQAAPGPLCLQSQCHCAAHREYANPRAPLYQGPAGRSFYLREVRMLLPWNAAWYPGSRIAAGEATPGCFCLSPNFTVLCVSPRIFIVLCTGNCPPPPPPLLGREG